MNERVAAFRIGDAETVPPARPARPVDGVKAIGSSAKRKAPAPAKRIEAARSQPAAAPKGAVAGANGGGRVPRMQAAIAEALNQDQDWTEF